MRIPNRDRCGSGLVAVSIVLMALFAPGSALTAEYTVLPNGTVYAASVDVLSAEEYMFFEQGMLGERIPLIVTNISVVNDRGEVIVTDSETTRITFPEGNYTIHYRGIIRDSRLHATFDEPYDVMVHLPPEFDVRNRLLGMISPGGVIQDENGTLSIHWNDVLFMECRFYDDVREQALFIFATFWLSLCAIFIVPFLFLRMRDRKRHR